jgi:hypothetical protein
LSGWGISMPKIIDFSDFKYEGIPTPSNCPSSIENIPQKIDIPIDKYKLTINILVHNHPNKINFTIDEVGKYINKKSEFIRRRINSGQIEITYFGDGPMIHISELARILTQGIK